MSEPTTGAIIGKVMLKFFPSVAGAFIAGLTIKYPENSTIREKFYSFFIAFVSGVLVAHFIGEAIAANFADMTGVTLDAVKFALGIFGLTLINNLISEIKPWLDSLRKKVFGEKND